MAQNRHKLGGLAATTIGILLLIGLFWGFNLFRTWPTTFFSTTSEDFIKDVYTTSFHVAYDDEATQCRAMNYPYGEYHTFSGMQPLVAMPLQLLRKCRVAHPERAVLPLMNLLILLSIVLCAIILYLLLYELKLPPWYAVAGALLITLMSPQLQRMGGHITLSYYCAIPLLLYLTLRHLRSGAWGWSAAIGICCLLFSLCHPYYLIFFVVISGGEHLYLLLRRKPLGWSFCRLTLSFLLQVVIPFLLFFILTHVGLQPGDRTSVPSGFHHYTGRLPGLIFPYGRLYFWEDSHLFSSVQWEARSYIGLLSVIVSAIILYRFFANFFRRRYPAMLRPTPSRELNLFLLLATALMIFACGVPFNWLPHNMVSYIGPLAQLRAQGRLVWLFYYVINIVAVYGLYHWWRKSPRGWRTAVLTTTLLLFSAEAVAYNWRNKALYINRWEEWTDYDNRLPSNRCLKQLDHGNYQAILTLPLFNVGSEFIYLPSKDDMFRRSALLSMKTGLPLVCNESSRSIITQAWDCIALSRPLWTPPSYPDNLPDERPLLLAVSSDSTLLTPTEKMLLHHATPVMEWNGIRLMSLPLDAFRKVADETAQQLAFMYEQATLDSVDAIIQSSLPVDADIHKHTTIYDGSVPSEREVEISLWISHIMDDQYSRSSLTVNAYNAGGACTEIFRRSVNKLIDIINVDANEGLIRLSCTLPDDCSRIQIKIRNREMRPSPVSFRNLLIRPASQHVASQVGVVQYIDNIPLPTPNPYVALRGGHFVLDGEPWFPLMLNYKAFIRNGEVVPAPWYTGGGIREHFDTIASWGFNAVRVCLDVMDEGGDTAAMYLATRRMVQQADSAGLRVMLLIKPPLDDYWRAYTIGLMKRLADLPALWAYDMMNEPLYFDPEPRRDKEEAVAIVRQWRQLVRTYAPHQLFTVATAEPIEVFEWDPSMLPVDFIEMHTYHPLRVQAEMWWYSHYCGKPWMVGETGLPADGDSVPYRDQVAFMWETYRYAKINGAAGYGWWEFQDCPEGVNFEAQYTGLRDAQGVRKAAAALPKKLPGICLGVALDADRLPPANYGNMLAYSNLAVTGKVFDTDGQPIEGAVVRGWNDDWSVGVNTYTDSTGSFRLVSNDVCVHFEVSAPGCSRQKFNRTSLFSSVPELPCRDREYQQIPLLGWSTGNMLLPCEPMRFAATGATEADMGIVQLKRF